jgi:hypothetical protein
MSEFKMLRYWLNQGDRQKNIEAVEQELQAMGYKRRETWVEDRKSNIFLCYIITFTDGTYYFGDPWAGLIEAEDRPIPNSITPYQQAVSDHMATAPQELRDYVCGKLVESDDWMEGDNPIYFCMFTWGLSKEGENFWDGIERKDWIFAMATEFWKSRTKESKPSKEAREFWERAFCSIAQSPRTLEKTLVEMADQAMAEWQKRFEA